MQKLWEYALRECLTVSDTQACNLLIIDSPHNDKDYKHKIADILFDELKVKKFLNFFHDFYKKISGKLNFIYEFSHIVSFFDWNNIWSCC